MVRGACILHGCLIGGTLSATLCVSLSLSLSLSLSHSVFVPVRLSAYPLASLPLCLPHCLSFSRCFCLHGPLPRAACSFKHVMGCCSQPRFKACLGMACHRTCIYFCFSARLCRGWVLACCSELIAVSALHHSTSSLSYWFDARGCG